MITSPGYWRPLNGFVGVTGIKFVRYQTTRLKLCNGTILKSPAEWNGHSAGYCCSGTNARRPHGRRRALLQPPPKSKRNIYEARHVVPF
jgi:hypothetical protein